MDWTPLLQRTPVRHAPPSCRIKRPRTNHRMRFTSRFLILLRLAPVSSAGGSSHRLFGAMPNRALQGKLILGSPTASRCIRYGRLFSDSPRAGRVDGVSIPSLVCCLC
ncbi:hypothetical protein BU26DRAFT_514495 [Trematosphaeria pertusa]|uniref:Uncharacterized protein n=1 Tax=Trematosphaeria pertusa TaxID=390896 RepID=A0A6A6IZN2_9PLEO|nr:uncharacterized protein BU26DRAFT_514495 [Trematosphaeria pertusa]KAF2254613.1 hypothetical protein BU26DRAFT_514495 [Trematosphaeria pertusa]